MNLKQNFMLIEKKFNQLYRTFELREIISDIMKMQGRISM